MIVTDQDPRLLQFASDVLRVRFDPAQSAWISSVDEEVEAVVVFTRFSPFNCEMSIATNGKKRWARREFIRACYRYPFVQRGLARITVVIEDGNEPSLSLCRKLGHVEEGTLKSWFGPKDGIVMRMLKSECKYL